MDQRLERALDAWLAARAKTGDEAAFRRLFERWRPRMLRHAGRLLDSADLAQDAVQDAWIAIARGVSRLDDPARFPAWAFRILTRRCADAVRTAVRNRRADGAANDPATEPPVRDGPDGQIALSQALALLPAADHALISLFYVEELGVGEISTALGIPPGTVKSRLFHARARLKSAYEGDGK